MDSSGVAPFNNILAQNGSSLAAPVFTTPGLECTKEIPGFRLANSIVIRLFIVVVCAAHFPIEYDVLRSRSERFMVSS